ncbi:MAG TPA: aminopeptidase [Myxococcales bacterium]|nr:aminopeptidase [Myxococcales bacterium]
MANSKSKHQRKRMKIRQHWKKRASTRKAAAKAAAAEKKK